MRGVLLLALLAGCPPAEEPFPCEEYPVVTWNSFAEGFLTEHCQSCHASTSPDRNEAPESVSFDDLDSALSHADRILLVATGEDPYMPPEGGTTEEERLQVEIWLHCYAE